MNKISTCAVALAITLAGLTAFAQEKPSTQTAADRDMGKLSRDGYKAMHDVSLARLAIFDGRPAEAKTYTNEAETALAGCGKRDAAT